MTEQQMKAGHAYLLGAEHALGLELEAGELYARIDSSDARTAGGGLDEAQAIVRAIVDYLGLKGLDVSQRLGKSVKEEGFEAVVLELRDKKP
jgi:hypothetical protein